MDKLKLIQNAEDIYTNKYYVGLAKSIWTGNSILLKYKYPKMFTEKVGLTITFYDETTIEIINWFCDDMTKDIENKLTYYFKLLGFKVT